MTAARSRGGPAALRPPGHHSSPLMPSGSINNLLGPGRNFADEVRRRVRALAGEEPAEVMLTATHAHSTPETLNFRPLTDQTGRRGVADGLVEQLAHTAAAAAASLRPVEMTVATGQLDGLAVQRRAALFAEGEELPVDREFERHHAER